MQKKILSSLLAALGLAMSLSAPSMAYPERPESARVIYEMWYFPCRLVSMAVTTAWDVPTAAFSDGIKGAIGGTKMVARNLGKEDGVYEMVAGAMTGGPAGLVAGGIPACCFQTGWWSYDALLGVSDPLFLVVFFY